MPFLVSLFSGRTMAYSTVGTAALPHSLALCRCTFVRKPRSFTLWADSLPSEPPGRHTGMGSLSLLQRNFPTQESNWGLLHCRQILLPAVMQFSRQEYWSGLPFPSPEELPNPGIKLWSPASQADSLPFEQ